MLLQFHSKASGFEAEVGGGGGQGLVETRFMIGFGPGLKFSSRSIVKFRKESSAFSLNPKEENLSLYSPFIAI